MKLFIPLLIVLIGLGAFANSQTELSKLASGYHAKHMCTCLFVIEQNEEFCQDLAKTQPNWIMYKIDHQEKTVKATFALFFSASAIYKESKSGCSLTPAQF